MTDIIIITNNPKVSEKYPNISSHVEGSVSDVFIAVRDAVHKGARIVSHPLSGAIEPYKSVAISKSYGELDMVSLQIIENAIAAVEDFRVIDLDIIEGVIKCTTS